MWFCDMVLSLTAVVRALGNSDVSVGLISSLNSIVGKEKRALKRFLKDSSITWSINRRCRCRFVHACMHLAMQCLSIGNHWYRNTVKVSNVFSSNSHREKQGY